MSSIFLLAILLLLGAVVPAPASDWTAGWRVQTVGGWDSNPLEALDEVDGDGFFRVQLEGDALRRSESWIRSLHLSLRGFDERYLDHPREERLQGEGRVRLDHVLGRRGGSGRIELSTRARSYPDSTRRDFGRDRIRWDGHIKLGPQGLFRPSIEWKQLRLRGSDEDDRTEFEVGLGYEWTARPGWALFGGLDLGGKRYQRASVQAERVEGELELSFGKDQRDDLRRVRLGTRALWRGGLYQLQYGYLSQNSNSVGASYGRHELRWLASRGLFFGISTQFYGSLQSTRYDDDLDEIFVLRPGEVTEAEDDNNLVALQVSRKLAAKLRVHVRHSWYRNESLLVGTFYDKRVFSAGLSWEDGAVSGF